MSYIEKIWHYRLTTIENQQILVSNVVVAILVFWLGYYIIKKANNKFKSFLCSTHNLSHDTVEFIGKLSLYIAIFVLTFISLDIANIPLTALTFIGGAFAVAAGLGSQNIVNNFFCGIILIFEKSLKIDDYIEVKDSKYAGKVKDIGLRYVLIKSFNDTEILVPNKIILENAIVNWSYSDNKAKINLTIKSNADYDILYKSISKITANEKSILIKPSFKIYLLKYDDNNYFYELSFYYDLAGKKMPKEIISDLNKALCKEMIAANYNLSILTEKIKITDSIIKE